MAPKTLSFWNPKSYRNSIGQHKRPSLQQQVFGRGRDGGDLNRIFSYQYEETTSTASKDHSEKFHSQQINDGSSEKSSETFRNFNPMSFLGRVLNMFPPTLIVLMRCLSNIFGVVLFARLAGVFGAVGIGFGVLLVLVCEAVVFITALSFSAIVTNGEIGEGGVYFLVSRALGPEFGFTIGVQFYLANCISVALYLLGLAEAAVFIFGLKFRFATQAIAIGCVLVVFLLIFCSGVDLILSLQIFVVLPLLFLGILLLLAGMAAGKGDFLKGSIGFSKENLHNSLMIPKAKTFFQTMAIFFPGTLGMMAGSIRAEKISNAEKAIPRGILLAIIFTTVSYIAIGLTVSFYLPKEILLSEDLVFSNISFFRTVFYVSLIATTASQAFTNFAMAPPILLRIAKDGYIKPLKSLSKSWKRRFSLLTTLFIALLFILPGEFNLIAPYTTSFVIVTYSVVNFACFLQSAQKTPNWRPRFKFYNGYVSLATSFCYLVLMFFLHYISAIFSLAFTAVLVVLVVLVVKPKVSWSGVMAAVTFRNIVSLLTRLDHTENNAKSYSMQLLVLVGENSEPLINFSKKLLKKAKTVVTVAHVNVPNVNYRKYSSFMAMEKEKERWLSTVKSSKYFSRFISSESVLDGVEAILQCGGVSKIEPNTVMMGYREEWRDNPSKTEEYVEVIRRAMLHGKALIILRGFESFLFKEVYRDVTVDIWWLEDDGGLTVLFPYLVSLSKIFSNVKLRVIEVISKSHRVDSGAPIARLLAKLRIPASVVPVVIGADTDRDAFFTSSEKFFWYACVANKMHEVSGGNFMSFVTLPVPNLMVSPSIYMSLLEDISSKVNRLVFVRGNNENVITVDM